MKLTEKLLILSTVSNFLIHPATQVNWNRNNANQRSSNASPSNHIGQPTWPTFGKSYNCTWWQKSQKLYRPSSSQDTSTQNAYHSFEKQTKQPEIDEFYKEDTYAFAAKPPEKSTSKHNIPEDWRDYQAKRDSMFEQEKFSHTQYQIPITKKGESVDGKEESPQPDFTPEQEEIVNKILAGNNSDFFYFELFGVEVSASSQDIQKAYRKKSLLVHPDRNKHPRANEAFTELQEIAAKLKQKAEEREELQKNLKENYEKGPMDFTTSHPNFEFRTQFYGGTNPYVNVFQSNPYPAEETQTQYAWGKTQWNYKHWDKTQCDKAQTMPKPSTGRQQYTSEPKQREEPQKDQKPTTQPKQKSKSANKSTHQEPQIQIIRKKGQPNRQKKQTFNHLPKKDQIKYRQRFQSRYHDDYSQEYKSTTEFWNQQRSTPQVKNEDQNKRKSGKNSQSMDQKATTESSHQYQSMPQSKTEHQNNQKPEKHLPSTDHKSATEAGHQYQSTPQSKNEDQDSRNTGNLSQLSDQKPATESNDQYQSTLQLKSDKNIQKPEKYSQSTDQKETTESSDEYQSMPQLKNADKNIQKPEKHSQLTDPKATTKSYHQYQSTPQLKSEDKNIQKPEKHSQLTDQKETIESSDEYQSMPQLKNVDKNIQKPEKHSQLSDQKPAIETSDQYQSKPQLKNEDKNNQKPGKLSQLTDHKSIAESQYQSTLQMKKEEQNNLKGKQKSKPTDVKLSAKYRYRNQSQCPKIWEEKINSEFEYQSQPSYQKSNPQLHEPADQNFINLNPTQQPFKTDQQSISQVENPLEQKTNCDSMHQLRTMDKIKLSEQQNNTKTMKQPQLKKPIELENELNSFEAGYPPDQQTKFQSKQEFQSKNYQQTKSQQYILKKQLPHSDKKFKNKQQSPPQSRVYVPKYYPNQ